MTTRHAQSRAAWLGRMLREFRPDHNPLRRSIDRAEAAIKLCLLAAFLALAPVAVATAVHVTDAATARTLQAQSSWRQVPAVLITNAPNVTGYGMLAPAPPLVKARWAAPDRSRRTGKVFAASGARAGSTVMVWTDPSGDLTGPPLPHSAPADLEPVAAVLALAALLLLLACCGTAAHRLLDRRRIAAWEADWATTEPRWTTRR